MTAEFALWSLLSVALVISVVTDLARRRILDVVTYPAAALALLLRYVYEGVGDLESGLISGLVAAVGAAACFAAFAVWKKGFGWGDVKLMVAVGAAFGYPPVVAALVFISLVGALQAAVTLMWHGEVWKTLGGAFNRLAAKLKLKPAGDDDPARRHIPYGVAIALGSFWAMWWEHSHPRGLAQ